MNRYDALRMAEEADAYADKKLGLGEWHPDKHEVRDEQFAKLVAAAERELCAKECETLLPSQRIFDQRYYEAVEDCVATIRARGENNGT
jgi:hypothetical protein